MREIEPGRRIVAVLDASDTWESATIDGHHVTVVPPGAEAAPRLIEIAPARIVVNLAASGALETMAALRATGSPARFWGCLASPEPNRALPLGMVEPAARPIDCDVILAALEGYVGRGTRVVTAGADVDALMSLRQAMARRQMSVSMAWDAKQATDLLGVVRPEIVVIDLELPRRDGYTIAVRLAAVDPIPSMVLIPSGEDPAAGFAALLSDRAVAGRLVPLAHLLATTIARSEATPAERKAPQKLRALGRK